MASAIETGMADVNGTRLYYEARGSGPALLFLNGFTLDHRMWNRQVAAFSGRYRVVTFDARGAGRSAMPTTEEFKHYEDAAALCRHLGLTRVVAIGHSIGAHYALELALEHPKLVAGFGSICMSGLSGVAFPEDVAKLNGVVRQAMSSQGPEAAKRIWAQSVWFASARETPTLAAEIDEILTDYSGWHWNHDNPARNIEPPASTRLREISIPSLIVTGGRDLAYNGVVGDTLLASIGGAVALRLPRAGHMANIEDPDAVNQALGELAERAFR